MEKEFDKTCLEMPGKHSAIVSTSKDQISPYIINRGHNIVLMTIYTKLSLLIMLFNILSIWLSIVVPNVQLTVPTDTNKMSHILLFVQIVHSY